MNNILRLSLFVVLLFLYCCKKDKNATANNCYDFAVRDSANISPPGFILDDRYYYNSDHQLQKHVSYSGQAVTSSDSFTYLHGNMVKSYFSLGSNTSSNPYTTSEYDYAGATLTGSRYYMGSTLIVHSAYKYDQAGRLITYTQIADNITLQSTPSVSYTLSYDGNSNLISVVDQTGTSAYTYNKYDSYPNPYYQLPFDFAYNIFDYSKSFSKNNFQVAYTYTAPYYNYNVYYPRDTLTTSNAYTYRNGEVSSIISTPPNGRSSNGPGTSHTLKLRSLCN